MAMKRLMLSMINRANSTMHARCLGNIVLLLSSLGTFFLLAEIILMFTIPAPIVWLEPQEFYLPDSTLSHKLKPLQESFTHASLVKTNSHGLREVELQLEREPGMFRILCLGDSLTFGNGVPVQETYPKQLEHILHSQMPGQRFQVINAGVPGYDTWQEAAYLKEFGWKLKPDVVIIGFYANDIVPKPEMVGQTVNDLGEIRRFGWKGLISDQVVHQLKRSRLLLLIRDRYDKLMRRLSPSAQDTHQLALINGSFHPIIEAGLTQVDSSLHEIAEMGETHGFRLLIVFFPLPEQVMRDYPSSIYPGKVKYITQKYHIPFIDLMPTFQKHFDGFGSLFIEWDGHPNAAAYNIAARTIWEYLRDENMVRVETGMPDLLQSRSGMAHDEGIPLFRVNGEH